MPYTLEQALIDTRIPLNDSTENVWTNAAITYYINQAISIIKKTVPVYFTDLVKVSELTDVIVIDSDYELLIALFASSRCLQQDEQDYRAVSMMNEFETRRAEMEISILESDEYATLIADEEQEYVIDNYYTTTDEDEIPPLDP